MKYTKAEMELVEFDVEDIIRTSGGQDNPDNPTEVQVDDPE